MSNANFITQFEYRLNNLSGESQAELLALKATADKYPELDPGAVALLDAAIEAEANTLTNSSSVKELSTVGNADAEAVSDSNGKSMIMPKFVGNHGLVTMKSGIAEYNNSESSFYAALEGDYTSRGFDTATYEPADDATEQTIVDTGAGVEGVLTSVIGARGSGVITIRVYIDGKLFEFTSEAITASNVFLLGDAVPWVAQINDDHSVGYGSYPNRGYSLTTNFTVMTPIDSVTRGLPIGMVFEDSLKITIQCSNNLTIGSSTHKAAAAWLTYIPEGVL